MGDSILQVPGLSRLVIVNLSWVADYCDIEKCQHFHRANRSFRRRIHGSSRLNFTKLTSLRTNWFFGVFVSNGSQKQDVCNDFFGICFKVYRLWGRYTL